MEGDWLLPSLAGDVSQLLTPPRKTRWLLMCEMAAWYWAGLQLHNQRVTSMDLPCYVTWNAFGGNIYRVSHAWGNTREKVDLGMLHGTELGNNLHSRSSCRCSKPSLGHKQLAIRAHWIPASQWCHFISQHCPLFSTDTYMQYFIILARQCSQSFSWTIINPVSAELGWKSQPLSPYDVLFCCFKIHLHFRGSTGNWRCWSDVQKATQDMEAAGCSELVTSPTLPPGPTMTLTLQTRRAEAVAGSTIDFGTQAPQAHEHVLSWWQALPPESLTRRRTSIKQTSRLSALIGYTAVGDGPTWHCASEDLWGRKASQSPPLALSHRLAPPGPRSLSGF